MNFRETQGQSPVRKGSSGTSPNDLWVMLICAVQYIDHEPCVSPEMQLLRTSLKYTPDSEELNRNKIMQKNLINNFYIDCFFK